MFGISEPAIFGVNLRYRFPLIGGCIGGAVAGAYAYFAKLNALGFGTTALPGIAIVNPENNGYINYIIAHIIALAIGFICTMLLGKVSKQNKNDEESIVEENRIQASQEEKSQPVITDPIQVVSPVNGVVHPISDSSDPTFAQKIIGDGIMVMPKDGEVKAPCNGTINLVYPSGHALGIKLEDGSEILLHIGIDTVNLNGEGFHVFVKENQTISKGDRLVTFDKDLIEKKGYSTEVLMIFSSVAEARNLTMDYTGTTEGNEIVAVLS